MKYVVLSLVFFILLNCSDDIGSQGQLSELPNASTRGGGFFIYDGYAPSGDTALRVYYQIPDNVNSNSPILFVFHGAGRNARDYRDAMISKSNQYGFVVVAPEFSIGDFPGGDAYNLGNVFVDGDNPSDATLNPEEEWTFSIVEPLFDYFTGLIGNQNLSYHIFGHSAGGQFAHRYIMFKPDSRVDIIVASASGWYTMVDPTVRFPYGFKESPLNFISLSALFSKNLIVLVGDLDNDPNAPGLRHNSFADAQGFNRYTRAQSFFQKAALRSDEGDFNYNWTLVINENADHNYEIACRKGADLIFN